MTWLRSIGLLCLLAAAPLWYLAEMDRRSDWALRVVEWEGLIGAPPWMAAAALGAVLIALAWASKPRNGSHAEPDTPARRSATRRSRDDSAEGSWLEGVTRRVSAAQLGPGAALQLEPLAEIPLKLELRRLTPEQARRAVSRFAELLGDIPLPPRAKIRYVDCQAPPTPRHKQVMGCLREQMPEANFRVMASGDEVDLLFPGADPRWTDLRGR